MTNNQFLNILGFAALFSYSGFIIQQRLDYIYEKYHSLIGNVPIKEDTVSDDDYVNLKHMIDKYEKGWKVKLTKQDINIFYFVLKAGDFDHKPNNIIKYFKLCINENTDNINNTEAYRWSLHTYWHKLLNNYKENNTRFFKLNSFYE
jgi:hypothetical protein